MMTTRYELDTMSNVLPTQCEKVFYSHVIDRECWSFVVIFNPRGRPIKFFFPKEDVHE